MFKLDRQAITVDGRAEETDSVSELGTDSISESGSSARGFRGRGSLLKFAVYGPGADAMALNSGIRAALLGIRVRLRCGRDVQARGLPRPPSDGALLALRAGKAANAAESERRAWRRWRRSSSQSVLLDWYRHR